MGINEIIKIGSRIKELRKNKGISQREMARMLDIPYSTYSNYENNNREPSLEVLTKVINILELDFEELLSYSDKLLVEPDKDPVNDKINKLTLEIENRLYLKKWIKETDLKEILECLIEENKDLSNLSHSLFNASKLSLSEFNLLSESNPLFNTASDELQKMRSQNLKKMEIVYKIKSSYIQNIIDKILLLISIEEDTIKTTLNSINNK